MPSFVEEYQHFFTPGAPVETRSLLFGRDGDLNKLRPNKRLGSSRKGRVGGFPGGMFLSRPE